MRLLTHNTMRCNTATTSESSSLLINAQQVRVDSPPKSPSEETQRREIEFVKHTLPILNWPNLLIAAKSLGLESLPPQVTPEIANDTNFLKALYHVLMNVHLVNGMLTCSETGREFPVTDGIVNMMLEEDECERVEQR